MLSPMHAPEIEVELIEGMGAVDAATWDALVQADDPFTEHAFLHTLEASGSVGEGTGWFPRHVLARRAGRLIGAAPAYVKGHSYGEYIFDWGWAEAARRAGLRYYPKVVCAVPHTPATGRRLLVAEGEGPEVITALHHGLLALADAARASSVHVLFATEPERLALTTHGMLPRLTYQFHWEDQGYGDFDGFLAALRSPARKQIRRERRDAAAHGLDIQVLRGDDITPEVWESMARFYRSTAARKGAIPYLPDAFFALARTTLRHSALVILARRDGEPVAGTLSFQKGRHLYGRYWGCLDDFEMLHFEMCYYVPLDLCLREGWTRFEAGAQGEHKLKRGFLPSPTYSAHWIRHPGLANAIGEWLPHETDTIEQEMQILGTQGPYRRDGEGLPGAARPAARGGSY